MDFSTNEWRTKVFYSLPTGWWMRFGDQLCDDIEHTVKKMIPGAQADFKIYDIKEENGSLHIYANWVTENLQEIFDKYRDLSIHTCICCGRPAEFYAWQLAEPYCAQHAPKDAIELNNYISEALKEV